MNNEKVYSATKSEKLKLHILPTFLECKLPKMVLINLLEQRVYFFQLISEKLARTVISFYSYMS